jgi:hypothetical protein
MYTSSMQIKKDYKKKLDSAAIQLSAKVDERVQTTKLLYFLIDRYLDKAVTELEKEY